MKDWNEETKKALKKREIAEDDYKNEKSGVEDTRNGFSFCRKLAK